MSKGKGGKNLKKRGGGGGDFSISLTNRGGKYIYKCDNQEKRRISPGKILVERRGISHLRQVTESPPEMS